MKKVLFLASAICLLSTTLSFAQSGRSEREKEWRAERELRRAEARAIEMQQDSIAYHEAVAALKDGSWALEANNVNFFNGITRSYHPTPTIYVATMVKVPYRLHSTTSAIAQTD